MVRAVIFDCDGVLIDSEIIAVEVETALLAEHGLHYEIPEFTARFMGMSDKAFYAALSEDSLARLGRDLPPDFKARVDAGKRVLNEQKLAAIAGIEDAVARLALLKAVASSSEAHHLDYKLRKTGLWDLFAPHIYSADHVTHAKPAPDLFLHAANALGVAPPRMPGDRGQRERREGGARGGNARVGLRRRRPHGRRRPRAPHRSRCRTGRRRLGRGGGVV